MLLELGWAPTVVAPDPERVRSQAGLELSSQLEGVEVRYTPFEDRIERARNWLRRSKAPPQPEGTETPPRSQAFRAPRYKQWFRALAAFPDEYAGWIPHAVEEGLRACSEGIDLLWTTSPPESAHIVGRILHARLRMPWVAELRDPWSEYHHVERGAVLRLLHRRSERRALRSADALVTLSPTWREHFAVRFGKPVALVRSGFDPADLPRGASAPTEPRTFRFVYTGKLHAKAQDPSPFFAALAECRRHPVFLASRVRVEVFFYGDGLSELQSRVSRFALDDVVVFRERVSYQESLRIQSQATVLLLFDWLGTGPIERGVIPLKAYEYLATGRPVLVFLSKDGDLAELARTSPSFVGVRSLDQAARQIWGWLDAFESSGAVPGFSPHGSPDCSRFTRRSAAESLAGLFDQVLERALRRKEETRPRESLTYA